MSKEDINLQHLAQSVEQLFPKNIFNVKITGGGGTVVEVDIEDEIGDDCISFNVYQEYIIIHNLYKCQIRGTVSLLNVEQIAIQMGIFKIMLSDGSHIITNCGINLRLDVLFILSSGVRKYATPIRTSGKFCTYAEPIKDQSPPTTVYSSVFVAGVTSFPFSSTILATNNRIAFDPISIAAYFLILIIVINGVLFLKKPSNGRFKFYFYNNYRFLIVLCK